MHASDTGELAFEDFRVPADAVLGENGKGFYHISWELQGERLVAAAGCYAGAERMFERTLEYAKEREAFGRPIGRFQAIRHKFADMATKIEAAKQLTHAVAWRFANGEYPVREISMAKLYAAQVCHEVADECVQILGGYGYMKEYEIERAYRDQRLNRIGAGTDEIMLEVIGRSYRRSRRSSRWEPPRRSTPSTCRSSPPTRSSRSARPCAGSARASAGPTTTGGSSRPTSRRASSGTRSPRRATSASTCPSATAAAGSACTRCRPSARRSLPPAARCS